MDLDILIDFFIAIAIGGLLGIEREIHHGVDGKSVTGFRTCMLIAFLGAITSYIAQSGASSIYGYMSFAAIILIVAISYLATSRKGFMGITDEVGLILVFVLASISMVEEYQKIAVIFGVVLTIILATKKYLHGFARKTKEIEWYSALKFIFMAFVVLPLLPNNAFDVLGINDAFNPYMTWLMVVFVSGIGFVGYLLTRLIGGSGAVGLTGVLGGIASSTAVTQAMADHSKKLTKNKTRMIKAYSYAAIAATIVKCFLIFLEVWTVNRAMLTNDALPVLVIAITGVIFISRWIDPAEEKDDASDIIDGNPLTLKPALIFGALYSGTVFITKLLLSFNLGSLGIGFLGLFSGLVEVHALTLSMVNLYTQGEIGIREAWIAIVAAVMSNLLFKAFLAKSFGSKEFFKKVGVALVVMTLVGAITSFILFF